MKKFILLFSLLLFFASPALTQRGGKGIKGQFKQLEVDQSIKLGGETILPFKIDTLQEAPANPYATSWEVDLSIGSYVITHNELGSDFNGIYCEFIAAADRQNLTVNVADHPGWDSDTISVTLATDSDTTVTTTVNDLNAAFDLHMYMNSQFTYGDNGQPSMALIVPDAKMFSDGYDGNHMDLPDNKLYLYHSNAANYLLLFKLWGTWYSLNTSTSF